MQTINVTNETPVTEVKNETPVKKEKVVKPKKETIKKETTKLNLSKFVANLKNAVIEDKKKRETIYIYPDELNTEEKRNGKKGKQFRNQQRSKIERFCNDIRLHTKYDRQVDLIESVKLFKANYKTFYRINDFSVSSVSQSASLEGNDKQKKQFAELSEMFEIIKAVDLQTAKKKK